MFQYAAGYALARKRNVPLLLDIRAMRTYPLHQGFELARVFRISGSIASDREIRSVLGIRSPLRALRAFRQHRFALFRGRRLIVEPSPSFWRGIESAPSTCYLDGYWQSEKYFSDFAEYVRSEFQFALPLEGLNSEYAEKISGCNAVAIHVRRGDYVSNPKNLSIHGLCSAEYYLAAVSHIYQSVSDPVFFVFSDDIEWARVNLQLTNAHFIRHNSGVNSHNDLRLMSMCKHQIIANSSFSWWGAWLNSSVDKIVIAPKRWFVLDCDTSDRIPACWVQL